MTDNVPVLMESDGAPAHLEVLTYYVHMCILVPMLSNLVGQYVPWK